MKFVGCTWYETKFLKEKDNLEALSKKVNLMSEILARPVLRNEHLRKPHDKQIVTAKQRGTWREKCTMLSKRDVSSDKMDTRRRSRNHMTVLAVTGKVQMNEDAQVFVRDFGLFVTVRLLDETPSVPSLRMLCSKNGYSFERENGETPRLANNGKSITLAMDNFELLVVPAIHSSSSCLQHRDQRASAKGQNQSQERCHEDG